MRRARVNKGCRRQSEKQMSKLQIQRPAAPGEVHSLSTHRSSLALPSLKRALHAHPAGRSPRFAGTTGCHTMQSTFLRNPLKTNKSVTRKVSHFFAPPRHAHAALPAEVAIQEHSASIIVVQLRTPFAIVLPVLAFLLTGSAPQRRRDPALRRRGCCGGVCAGGPRRRLRSGLPPLPRRFCARPDTN